MSPRGSGDVPLSRTRKLSVKVRKYSAETFFISKSPAATVYKQGGLAAGLALYFIKIFEPTESARLSSTAKYFDELAQLKLEAGAEVMPNSPLSAITGSVIGTEE